MATIEKARYWQAIMYPENMIENWKDVIESVFSGYMIACQYLAFSIVAINKKISFIFCYIQFLHATLAYN